jgi:hypothetical protein
MFRKTLLAIAAAATLALGLGSATAPAEAGHRRAHIGIYIGTPYVGFYHHRGHRHGHCHIVRVKKHHGWKRVKSCHSHRHGHPHH